MPRSHSTKEKHGSSIPPSRRPVNAMFTKTTLLLCAVYVGLSIADEDGNSFTPKGVCRTSTEEVKCPGKLECYTETVDVGKVSSRTFSFCHPKGVHLPEQHCLSRKEYEPLVSGLLNVDEECDPFSDDVTKTCIEGMTCCQSGKGHMCFNIEEEKLIIDGNDDAVGP